MKTKNTRLNFKDLFTGRIIHLTEPGSPVVEAKVTGFYNTTIEVMGIHFCNGEERPTWNSDHGDYDILPCSEELMAKMGFAGNKPKDGTPDWVVLTRYHFPSKGVMLEIAEQNGNTKVHSFQDIYFNPNESHVRAFAKRKQAERYSTRFTNHYPGSEELETIFYKE
jgi:hypothetical protein